jgi:ABC-2 type transport system permease protein
MSAFLHHLAYDFRTGVRDKSKLLLYYLFPLVFFALVGGIMTGINPGFKDTMLPAMILFALMSSTLLAIPPQFVQARESGVFRSYRINGVPSGSIISIPVIGTALHMAVVAVVICIAGAQLFGGVPPVRIAGFVLAGLLSYAAYAGMGVLIGVTAANENASMLLAQLLYIPSILLGGLMMPASILPEGLQRAALLLPAAHCMRVFAGLAFSQPGTPIPWLSIAVLAASVLLSFGLAGWLFAWDSRLGQSRGKTFAALLVVVPYAAAALLGG